VYSPIAPQEIEGKLRPRQDRIAKIADFSINLVGKSMAMTAREAPIWWMSRNPREPGGSRRFKEVLCGGETLLYQNWLREGLRRPLAGYRCIYVSIPIDPYEMINFWS
jgi:hypothetical protein